MKNKLDAVPETAGDKPYVEKHKRQGMDTALTLVLWMIDQVNAPADEE